MPKLKCALAWGVKLHSLRSNTRPKHFHFNSFLYGLMLFHIGPKDIGLTVFAKHLS
jgi:hypothetical protein